MEAVKPTYRLALLTALAFLLVAPLPLQLHLGHPERSFEMYLTPHTTSAMAMFGFVYLWYLMVVLVLEIWLDYRKDIVLMWRESSGPTRWLYGAMALWSDNISPERRCASTTRSGGSSRSIGIPSAFLLHGYVGFIFGSVKANPWWSTPLMPIVFLFSAIVSGIALVMLMYMVTSRVAGTAIDMRCVDTIARYLFYAFIIDFSLEMLDLIHRIYEADESFKRARLHGAHAALHLAGPRADRRRDAGAARAAGPGSSSCAAEKARRRIYAMGRRPDADRHLRDALERGDRRPALLEELPGLHHLQDGVRDTKEGLLPPIILLILPFVILILVKLLPPWPEKAGARQD